MSVVTQAEFPEKIRDLTETKFQIRLDCGNSVYLSLWAEHEYQLEAFEDAINSAIRNLKNVDITWIERAEDDSTWTEEYRLYRQEMDKKLNY